MAALIILSDVQLAGERIQPSCLQVGEAVLQGQTLRKGDTGAGENSGKWYLARNASLNEAACEYIALTGGGVDDFVVAAKHGDLIVLSSSVAVGTFYYVGAVDGEIVPETDLVSANYVTQVGYGVAANTFKVLIEATKVPKP